MRFCLLLCATALSTAAIAQTRPALAPPTDAAAGKQIFDSQCAWCHGTDGEGGTGPNLRGKLSHATDLKTIADVIQNGIPGTEMPALGLTEAQLAANGRLRAVAVTRNGPSRPRQRAARRRALSRARLCVVPRGTRTGGVLGPELTAIATRRGAPYLRDALVKPEATHPPRYVVVRAVPANGPEIRGNRVNEDVFWIQIRDTAGTVHSLDKSTLTRLDRQLDATLMPSYATRLSAAELDDLVAYLVTLRGDH
jgi:putative heme-binding domain-containing protein